MDVISFNRQKTAVGLFWSAADLLATSGIQFLIQIVLARLLLPEHFGVIGMILVLIAVSNALVDCGFSQSLIRDQRTSQEDYSTVFHFNLFISIIIYFLLYVSAPFFSIFFNTPELVGIIRVLSIIIIINSLGIIQRVKLIKTLNFKALTKINISGVFLAGCISIIMGYLGFGVWSLVVNMIAIQIFQTLFLWIFSRWIPSLIFNINSFKKYFGFGYKLLLSGLIDTINNNLYYLVIGRFYSVLQLGYYSNAVRVRDMASQGMVLTVQRVTYPVLSGSQDDDETLKVVFRSMIRMTSFVNFPLMIGGAVIAAPLFQIFFGEKWLSSVDYFQILCIAGMLYPIHALNLNILKVKGRSDLFLLLEIIKASLIAVLITLSIIFDLGIMGLIWTAVISSFLSLFINTYYSSKLIDYSVKRQVMDLVPIFVISIMMGLLVLLAGYALPYNYIINLFCQICIGLTLYILLCKLFRIKELKDFYQLVFKLLFNK